ncbi:YjbF family lipoprotein [Sedimentitalea nanhaiensis]|uniref:Group 4 capsule polysaccharide lipoprotein gfcB, YjbF n=1 Tax=Sedimentitalea nanhaiensis TaxID=999627 RepID=A0A1I7E297_9RHOB|nr:YjbF family lipoprotein [Sedimentitalea nanhaiensis]SFU18024.1 Group 4 capsule polysaccharide lipoprotein gfcB, YjbF [Sedimentitalea nanhaiensis]
MIGCLVRLRGLALLALLAACSGGTDAPTLQLQVIDAARASIAARSAPAPERPPLTRAVLDTLDGAFLEITREREDLTAFLYPSLQRRDGSAGEIVVWRTETDETVTLRGGVLIATRGLGGDVLSTEVQLGAGGLGPASGQRVLHVADKDNKQLTLPLACDVVDLGAATIEIIGWTLPTRHLQERCEGGGGTVVNDYWVDPGNGPIWQSRQWAGPHIGYLRLRQVTR